jgi:endonuclease/exonuclease/phosphatase family metal-dependent hydrolase
MKKSHAWTFTILLILVFISLAGHALADTLTIATFNCEFLTRPKVHVKYGLSFNLSGTARQEWEQPGFRDQKFNEATKVVAEVIHSINADVIALTEVGDATDVEELRSEVRALGFDYRSMAVCDSADTVTKQHVAVLSRFPLTALKASIPGREGYLEELDDPETEDDTGISKGMRVTVLAHGREIILYVLHLASERGGHEQDQQRISQASIVRRHYLPSVKEGRMVIVAGDLNEKRGQPTLLRIRGLHDIDADLIQTGHKRYFDSHKLDTRWTYEFEGVRQQIDHVLLSYSVKDACKRGGIKARTFHHDNPLASDHRPFIVTLRLKD